MTGRSLLVLKYALEYTAALRPEWGKAEPTESARSELDKAIDDYQDYVREVEGCGPDK